MEDDAIFQMDPRGPGGSEYVTVVWHRVPINAALLRWTTPGGHAQIPLVVLRCPLCDHPIAARPDISAECKIEQGRLTLRQVVRCPAHWPRVDEQGNVASDPTTGKVPRTSCEWAAVIVDGFAHLSGCATVRRLSPGACTCRQGEDK